MGNEVLSLFSCDVDGILNDYPRCWLKYLAEKCGTLYDSVNLAKKYEGEYRRYKDEYRNSSYKANLPVHKKNRDAINSIIAHGYEPLLVTSRPIFDEKYPQLLENTIKWLRNGEVKFDKFEYKDPKAAFLEKYPNVKFHIDDDPNYALKIAEKGVKVYLLQNDNWDFSIIDKRENIQIVRNLEEILNYE